MLTAIAIAAAVGFLVLIALICAAPEGFETDEGFFYGPYPRFQGPLDPRQSTRNPRQPIPGGHLERGRTNPFPRPRSLCASPFHAEPVATERREHLRDR